MLVPAVDFSENINKSMQVGDVLNKEQRIHVTPTEFFTTKLRQIFKDTHIKFTTSVYGRKWLGAPHMTFWQQQLNVALCCATTGCGISRDILFFSASSLDLSPTATVVLSVSTFISRSGVYYTRWVEFRALAPCQMTPRIIRKTINMMFHRIKGFVQNSVSIPAQTFASHMGKTTVSVMLT